MNNLREEYRKVKKELENLRREVLTVLNEYDGDHAIDFWDHNVMPSRGWEAKMNALKSKLSPEPTFKQRKAKRKREFLKRVGTHM